MEDVDIYKHIEKLVYEEHEILELSAQGGLDDERSQRMQQIEKFLDQCWDLLRQRRARRVAGLDPGDARLHDPAIAEYFPQ